MPVATLADQVAITARLGRVAKVIGAGETMAAHLSDVTSAAFVDPVVFSDADVRTAGITTALDAGDKWLARRMASLASGISGSKALARAIVARRGELRIERGVGSGGPTAAALDGVYAALAITGPSTLDDDLIAATAIGLSELAARALAERVRLLTGDPGPRDRMLRVTVFSNPAGHDATIELGTRVEPDGIVAGLAGIAVSSAQLRLLERVHPILAAGRPVWLRVGVTSDTLEPHVTLVYGSTPLDNARRVVSGLATTDTAEARFAAFTAAAGGADAAAWIELAVGPVDPVRLRIGVAVKA